MLKRRPLNSRTRLTRTETTGPLLYSEKLGLRSAVTLLRIRCNPGRPTGN
jgi:hypothetical protein